MAVRSLVGKSASRLPIHSCKLDTLTREYEYIGFPRRVDQAEYFESHMGTPSLVLAFDCPFSVLEERLRKRAEHAKRIDDGAVIMQKRFDQFATVNKPVIDNYKARDLVAEIDASKGVDLVHRDVQAALKHILADVPRRFADGIEVTR